MVYQSRNKYIIKLLISIWLITILVSFLGPWKNVTIPLLFTLSTALTIMCIISIKKKTFCNISLGLCIQWLALIAIFAGYKILFWQFKISLIYLIGIILLYIIVVLLTLINCIKKGITYRTKGISSKYSWSLPIPIYLFSKVIRKHVDQKIANETTEAIGFVGVCFILLPFALAIDKVAYFVLEDDKVLYEV